MIAINKKKRNLQVVSEVTFILQGRWSTGNKDVFVNIKKMLNCHISQFTIILIGLFYIH